MIILQGHNHLGHVVHVITGPESEFFSDLHGACIMDITPIVAEINNGEKVYLSVTRTKSEATCLTQLAAAGLTGMSTFPEPTKPMLTDGKQTKAADAPEIKQAKQDKPEAKPHGKCSYCLRKAELVNIPGVAICQSCAIIELAGKEAKAVDDLLKTIGRPADE